MAGYDDIAEAIRSSAVATDPMFARKGKDAAGLTAEIDAMDLRDNSALNEIDDPAIRERVVEKIQSRAFARREAAARYEMNEVLKWSRTEVTRRAAREAAQLAADFGRDLDVFAAQEKTPEEIQALDEAGKNNPDYVKYADVRDMEFRAKVAGFARKCQEAYGPLFAAYKNVGYTDAEAQALAEKSMNNSVVASLAGFAENGSPVRLAFVDAVLGEYGKSDARYMDGVDEQGNKLIGKDGKVVKTDVFDPAGGLWMTDDDVAKLKGTMKTAVADAQRRQAAASAQAEDAMMANIAKIGSAGDAILANPDYTYDAELYGKVITQLDEATRQASSMGLHKVANASAENARRLRNKAQTMIEKRNAYLKMAREEADRIKASGGYAQFKNDELMYHANCLDTCVKIITDGTIKTEKQADKDFYMRNLCREIVNMDGLTQGQRAEVKKTLDLTTGEWFSKVVHNTQRLMSDIGFMIDPDAQTRTVLYHGAYDNLDGAPAGQGSETLFINEAGKAVIGSLTQVSWEDAKKSKTSERHFGFMWSGDETLRMDGLMKPEINNLVGQFVKMVDSIPYDLYDGNHEREREEILKRMRQAAVKAVRKKDINMFVNGLYDAAVEQTVRGKVLSPSDATRVEEIRSGQAR